MYAFGLIFITLNEQILKYNLPIWSHCLSSFHILQNISLLNQGSFTYMSLSRCSAILNVELEIVQANSCRYDSWVRNCYYIIFIRCPLYKYVYKGHNMELFSKRRFASSYINKKLNQLLYPTNTLKQPRSFSSTYLTWYVFNNDYH